MGAMIGWRVTAQGWGDSLSTSISSMGVLLGSRLGETN